MATRLGLTRDRIVEVALSLVDEGGLDSLTMRRLAEELGVGTMTVYGYFRTKDELLDAIVDSRGRAVPGRPLRGSWKQQLRELMRTVRRSHIDHPGIVELRLRRPLISAGALRVTEAAMRVLLDAGFTRKQATRAYRTLFIYTFGFSAFGPGERGEAERVATLAAIADLPPDRYPALTRSVREASDAMADQSVFELGLDCILDGLVLQLERRPPPRR